jgi:hypothetical protein
MFARIMNILIAAVIVSATVAVAGTVQAAPPAAPTPTEKLWMDRASGSVDNT